MSTNPREVIAAVDGSLGLNEAALKQPAVLFNRIALPGVTKFRNAPDPPPPQPSITSHLTWLADAGIVFEPDIKPTEDQGIKNQLLKDLDDLYEPIGVTGEEFLSCRKDEQKALEIRSKIEDMEKSAAYDPVRMFAAIQRMSLNTIRFLAIGLRNFHNMDAHVIVPAELSPFEVDDDRPNTQDVLKITIAALPLPDKDVSWPQIVEYRNDPNSFSRFLDLRNWIKETARGELKFAEVEEKLGAVLKGFRKQMYSHQLKTVNTAFEAFVTTNSNALHNLFSFDGSTTLIGASCSVEQRKVSLFENEAVAQGGEVAYVLGTACLFAE